MRLNNTPTYDANLGGYRSQSKWSAPGLADLLVIDREEYGQAVFLEVKTAKGKQSNDQKLFEKRCGLSNARYHVVKSVDDVKKLKL